MSNFRFIGLRPLPRCEKRFLKNLQPGLLYQFYDEYRIFDVRGAQLKGNAEASCYGKKQVVPASLYNNQAGKRGNGLRINVSAIAGKNGSGKSTLADLLFAMLFVFSVKKYLLLPCDKDLYTYIKELEKELRSLREKIERLKETIRRPEYKLFKKGNSISSEEIYQEVSEFVINKMQEVESLEKLRREKIELISKLSIQLAEYKRMPNKVRSQLFYELDDTVYELTVGPQVKTGATLRQLPIFGTNESNENLLPLTIDDPIILAKHLFYTIGINYSHYSLNSNYLGDWLAFTFHKNDGYRMPLVLNPMRTNGNVDINIEMGLARTRLLSNCILENLYLTKDLPGVYITENQYIHKVIFRLDKAKIARIPITVTISKNELQGDERSKALLMDLLEMTYGISKVDHIPEFALREVLLNYLISKIDSITENYEEFSPGYLFDKTSDHINNKEFLRKLITDRSHITYKLHQALNFLHYHSFDSGDKHLFHVESKDLSPKKDLTFFYSLTELYKWMGSPEDDTIMRRLPPSIFEVDLQLSNIRNQKSRFSSLSSGEQQMVHTIQSIVYHVNNINSARAQDRNINYRAVNIVLDEIELYFHPDIQRAFISRLTQALDQLPILEDQRVETINLLFLTHSPYILSDIPSNNVLRLAIKRKGGKALPVDEPFETFAANIHELLAKSFFIEGTSMGEFAEKKINELIDKIKSGHMVTEDDRELINLIGDSFLKSSINRFIEHKVASK